MNMMSMTTFATQPSSRQRLAIIGTGISGLVCAHRLQSQYDLTLFEANNYIGGHTNTIDVELDGEQQAVDTGFVVYNERNYPNFVRLLDELNVATQPTAMSFSVRCDRTGIEYNGTSLNTLFAQRRNLLRPRFIRMIRDILRFNRESLEVLEWDDAVMTVGEYVSSCGYGEAFVEQYLVPMGASIWSCPAGRFRDFPIRFVVEFFNNHAMLQVGDRPVWRVVRGGSQEYVRRLIKPFEDRIRLRTPVESVGRLSDRVFLRTAGGEVHEFDQVIFACHSDQALRMLDDPTAAERDLLSAFPYQRNEAVLHTDESILPRTRRAWAAWNYHVRTDHPDQVAITYNMNILQTLRSQHTLCVTLNESDLIDESKIIRQFVYHHPVFTNRRDAAQARHHELIDTNRTSYCGAYWGYGFHEDGVRSALAVCEALERAPVPA